MQINQKIFDMVDFLTNKIIKESKIIPFFCFTSLINSLKNSTQEIIYIDTKEISNKYNSHKTMEKISKILKIDFNNSIDDFDINYSGINIERHIFPYISTITIKNEVINIIFDINKNVAAINLITTFDINGIEIFVSYKNCKDSQNKLNIKDLRNKENIIIYTKILKEIEEKINKLKTFINNGGIEYIILDSFKDNLNIKNNLKEFLEYEVSNIRQNAPHIIESWDFYQKFLKLYCP